MCKIGKNIDGLGTLGLSMSPLEMCKMCIDLLIYDSYNNYRRLYICPVNHLETFN